MLTASQGLELLANASPELLALWKAFSADWPEDPPWTIAFTMMGERLCRRGDPFSIDDVRRVLEIVERILRDGDDRARNAAATGLLEAVLSNTDYDPGFQKNLLSLMGPESRRYCEAWNRFTGGHT